ncbi:MAG: hypothetical protein O7B27_01580 [Gammaproteobacteria bacterium]|nr:hypothetical protein [Pseudomonadota bacterium]MCZ6731233.1 hypothetical protein [Gammaproteobacteria bacterium]
MFSAVLFPVRLVVTLTVTAHVPIHYDYFKPTGIDAQIIRRIKSITMANLLDPTLRRVVATGKTDFRAYGRYGQPRPKFSWRPRS